MSVLTLPIEKKNNKRKRNNRRMKKTWIFAAFVAAALCATPKASAQSASQIPPMTPELTQAADAASQQYKAAADEKEQKSVLKVLFKKRKKEELLSLGNYYLQKKDLDMAYKTVEELYHDDGTYVPGLMLYGEVMYARKEYGKAGEKFDEAIYQNPELKEAYLKKAQVYKFVSPQTAEGSLMELLNIDPDYKEAMRELASIYYTENKVPEAIKTYEDYFKKETQPELQAQKDYAVLLFLDKKYPESLAQVEKILPKDPKDISLNRMKFYDLIETSDYEGADTQKDKFFGQYNDTLYNYSDYMYLGKLQRKQRDYTSAIASLEKSISMKKDFVANYKELGDIYERAKQYDKAIETYKSYISKLGAEVPATELYSFGRVYYSAASDLAETNAESPKLKEYITAGDTLFAQVTTRTDSYLGPFWRARLNSLTNPNDPLDNVKSYYDEAAKRLEGKDNPTSTKECLRYSAFYYMKKDQNAEARDYCNKLLALDPDDSLAKQILRVVSE